MSQTKKIERWRIVPSSDNTVSLLGVVDGRQIQSTPIRFARPGEVMTEKSHYLLGEKSVGVWEIELSVKRPSQFKNLCAQGIL